MVVYHIQGTANLSSFASSLKYFAYIHIFLLTDSLISMMLNPPYFEGLEIN